MEWGNKETLFVEKLNANFFSQQFEKLQPHKANIFAWIYIGLFRKTLHKIVFESLLNHFIRLMEKPFFVLLFSLSVTCN